MGKSDPSENSSNFNPRPWSVRIEGLVDKSRTINLEDLLKDITIEDRVYRLRCVEGWSMVIPWQGFSLKKLIQKIEPLSSAKYIQFETVYRPEEMSGQRKLFNSFRGILPWPYVEGLRMDEAMHPLTIISTGLYGHDLLNQNGAPLRLVVPWKYGFKSIKSIIAFERRFGFKKIDIYRKFFESTEKQKKIIKEKLNNFKKRGKKIVALGASHSTTVMLYHFGIKDYFKCWCRSLT